ncbi:hypothetical protein, partial [Mesobacillus selenatarsenatis]|uniref:hypothetical protein n=1 Tax=Mesobacillus selenatarsenatis TaxID=388741 RepID=UPI001E367456
GHQYALLVTSFSVFQDFRTPIRFIGDLFFRFPRFQDTNTLYRCPFPEFWNFQATNRKPKK